MQTNELSEDKLRQLAKLRADGPLVLSVFLNLDPSEFPTAAARATEMHSVLDEAGRRVRETDGGLSHDKRRALAEDVERVRSFLEGPDFSAKGAHGLAVFCASSIDLFDVLRLPRAVDTHVEIDDAPLLEPLAELAGSGSWCILIVNRRTGRMLRGSPTHMEELPALVDEVHGQHDQGGWSQARYQRSVEKDVDDHLKRCAEVAFRRFKRSHFDRIVLGGPEEILASFEERLHPYLRERLSGRVNVDVEASSPDEILRAARPTIERVEHEREREALDRLREGIARDSRAAGGLEGVLEALNERRVETLLIREGFDAQGCSCPQCAWLGPYDGGSCPADGTPLECRENVIEKAVESAIGQAADVIVVRDDANELDSYGSIAAVLRF